MVIVEDITEKEEAKAKKKGKENKGKNTSSKSNEEVLYPPPPFPSRLVKKENTKSFKRFSEMIRKLTVNLPLSEALLNMPTYAKHMKNLLTGKSKLHAEACVTLRR